MKKWLDRMKNRDGSVIVIVALSITVFMMIAAIVVDLGACYISTSNLQNAVDAAALAAGGKLPVSADDMTEIGSVRDTATLYIQKNDADCSNIIVEPVDEISGKYTAVRVSASRKVKTLFSGLIGINEVAITRSATSQLSPNTEMTGIVPLSIDKTYMTQAIATGQTTHLTLKFGAADGVQGSFGAVDLDGSQSGGANDYSCNLLYGYSGAVTVGEVLPVEPGNMSGPTFGSFWSRYDSCTHFSGYGGCTADHYVVNCPRIVTVPVIQSVGTKSVEVCGFAAFVLESGTGNGTGSTVTGSFINLVTRSNTYDANGYGSPDDYGVYSLHLTS